MRYAALSGAGWKRCRLRIQTITVTAWRRPRDENPVRIWVDFLFFLEKTSSRRW